MTVFDSSAVDILLDEFSPDERERAMNEVENPSWERARSRGDWKAYVACRVRDAWPRLSADARLAAYVTAREMVRAEP